MVSIDPTIVSSRVTDQVVQCRASIGSLMPKTDTNVKEVRRMYEGETHCASDRMSESLRLKPFRDTNFGKLPPEIRQMIFTNLLASPPAYGGYDFRAATESSSGQSPISLASFVDLKGSWFAILRTCRQIHLEAFPVFYASKSYYVANVQDLVTMLGPRNYLRVKPGLFRLNTITSLCLRNIFSNRPRHSPAFIDLMMSKYQFSDRESLQAKRTIELDSELLFINFQQMKSLRNICLCILAGQEREVLRFLFNIRGFGRGVIDFTDDFKWKIRSRNESAEDWKLQYPGFCYRLYRKGKNNRIVDAEKISTQKEVLDISSRASDLTEGDERWIEIDLGARFYEETKQHHKEILQNVMKALETGHNTPDSVIGQGSESQLERPAEEINNALVKSKKRHTKSKMRGKNVQKNPTELPTAPETPQIHLTTMAKRNSSLDPEKEKVLLPNTYTKLQLRATTIILALSLAYVIQSDKFEETISQLLTLFLSILLFFTVVAVWSEQSG